MKRPSLPLLPNPDGRSKSPALLRQHSTRDCSPRHRAGDSTPQDAGENDEWQLPLYRTDRTWLFGSWHSGLYVAVGVPCLLAALGLVSVGGAVSLLGLEGVQVSGSTALSLSRSMPPFPPSLSLSLSISLCLSLSLSIYLRSLSSG